LIGEKSILERKRQKLLEAHYNDAIPLDLLRTEQQLIAKQLAVIDHEIKMHRVTFGQVSANLSLALTLVEDCGAAYRSAPDSIKKLLNQAIFDKFLIENEPDGDVRVEVKLKAPFDQILEPIREDIAMINRAKQNASDHLSEYIEIAKRRIRDFFGCGLDIEQNKSSYSTNSNFFESESSSKNFLVRVFLQHFLKKSIISTVYRHLTSNIYSFSRRFHDKNALFYSRNQRKRRLQ